MLIEAGAKVNAQTKEGFTPLHIIAFDYSQNDFVKILVDAGAQVSPCPQPPLFFSFFFLLFLGNEKHKHRKSNGKRKRRHSIVACPSSLIE
jgi:hypothetical protein